MVLLEQHADRLLHVVVRAHDLAHLLHCQVRQQLHDVAHVLLDPPLLLGQAGTVVCGRFVPLLLFR